MTEKIRKDLLHVQRIGLDLYSTFIKKTKRRSDTIQRNNLKTFTSIRTEKKAIESKKKEIKKESVQALGGGGGRGLSESMDGWGVPFWLLKWCPKI